jgi:glycosyltransferase involved in cell wall biosynthesis
LLTVGLLEPEYDLRLQIDMLETLREGQREAGLIIIGSGSLDADLREYLATKAYSEHVLLAGDIPHSSTLDAISRCDVMLRTTLYDGDSISVREALHLGTPVVATDTGMRPAGVHLFHGGGPRSLAALTREVLSLDRRRADRKDDSTERNLQAVLDLYRELQ